MLAAFVSVGLIAVTGAPHCAAMCGPLSACVARGDARRAFRFHLGRFIGYSIIGAIAGVSGSHLATLISARWLTSVAAATAALILLWAAFGELRPRGPADPTIVPLGRKPPLLQRRPITCGSLAVFLPCGVLWAAVAIAAGTRSWLIGAAVMGFFAILTGLAVAGLAAVVWRARRAFGRRALAGFFALGAAVLSVLAVASFFDDAEQDEAASCPFHSDGEHSEHDNSEDTP